MKKCPNCQHTFGDEMKFCPDCGTELRAETPTCSKCGANLTPDQNFCPVCGTPAKQQNPSPVQKTTYRRSVAAPIFLGFLLLLYCFRIGTLVSTILTQHEEQVFFFYGKNSIFFTLCFVSTLLMLIHTLKRPTGKSALWNVGFLMFLVTDFTVLLIENVSVFASISSYVQSGAYTVLMLLSILADFLILFSWILPSLFFFTRGRFPNRVLKGLLLIPAFVLIFLSFIFMVSAYMSMEYYWGAFYAFLYLLPYLLISLAMITYNPFRKA